MSEHTGDQSIEEEGGNTRSDEGLASSEDSAEEKLPESAGQRRRQWLGHAKLVTIICVGIAIIQVVMFSTYFYSRSHSPVASPTPVVYSSVDTISCDDGEQTDQHYHAHLTLYINSRLVFIPQKIGIKPDESCYYWLHTHTSTGVIHIEAPSGRTFTLGNFLDIWKNKFAGLNYPDQLDQTRGWVTYVDGQATSSDFHKITLKSHELITLAYHSPGVLPDKNFVWGSL